MPRGAITPEITKLAFDALGIKDFCVRQLRLMVYVHNALPNWGDIDSRSVNDEECEFLDMWERLGLIEVKNWTVTATKEFWDTASQIVWMGYVDHE